MVWSTSQLAELAGTTVNTVRHYHALGLLAEPERRANGYKSYGVQHLVRVLQVRRLSELGVPLSKVPDAVAGGDQRELLRELHSELETSIRHLERIRDEVGSLMAHGAPLDTPSGFEGIADGMTPTDRTLASIFGQVYDDPAMQDIRAMFEDGQARFAELDATFEALTVDASEEARSAVVQQMLPALRENLERYPWLLTEPRTRQTPPLAQSALIESMRALYNDAQLEVLLRALAQVRSEIDAHDDGKT
ncbi:MerR family transcriptional regulator [Pseudoclavibacter sp. VKM Ac-2867]|uniref:MerR family transcriptional regulator n=1 Tax=Pseudoclavibacter sp. VKM Ac-2867 TaxID=2783829 RepID=UPI00188AD6A7|nr:MerR family transcriptional regulator [Pseudoclavibacter sp. VKM Ac-2867]MBF4460265.1 MerR family transcriptional regulator [Pseudoclavibacter sp. VKM Ac-2867]